MRLVPVLATAWLALLSPAWAAPQVYISPGGVDHAGCGVSASAPCASLKFAVEVIGPGVMVDGASGPLEVVVASGTYGPASCNVTAGMNLTVTGAGSDVSVFDCGGTSRLLVTNSSLWVADVTVRNTAFVGNASALCEASGGGAVVVASNTTSIAVGLTRVVFVNSQAVLSEGIDYCSVGAGGAVLVVFPTGSVAVDDCDFVECTMGSSSGESIISGGALSVKTYTVGKPLLLPVPALLYVFCHLECVCGWPVETRVPIAACVCVCFFFFPSATHAAAPTSPARKRLWTQSRSRHGCHRVQLPLLPGRLRVVRDRGRGGH
jgi:hypothetical protein